MTMARLRLILASIVSFGDRATVPDCPMDDRRESQLWGTACRPNFQFIVATASCRRLFKPWQACLSERVRRRWPAHCMPPNPTWGRVSVDQMLHDGLDVSGHGETLRTWHFASGIRGCRGFDETLETAKTRNCVSSSPLGGTNHRTNNACRWRTSQLKTLSRFT